MGMNFVNNSEVDYGDPWQPGYRGVLRILRNVMGEEAKAWFDPKVEAISTGADDIIRLSGDQCAEIKTIMVNNVENYGANFAALDAMPVLGEWTSTDQVRFYMDLANWFGECVDGAICC